MTLYGTRMKEVEMVSRSNRSNRYALWRVILEGFFRLRESHEGQVWWQDVPLICLTSADFPYGLMPAAGTPEVGLDPTCATFPMRRGSGRLTSSHPARSPQARRTCRRMGLAPSGRPRLRRSGIARCGAACGRGVLRGVGSDAGMQVRGADAL